MEERGIFQGTPCKIPSPNFSLGATWPGNDLHRSVEASPTCRHRKPVKNRTLGAPTGRWKRKPAVTDVFWVKQGSKRLNRMASSPGVPRAPLRRPNGAPPGSRADAWRRPIGSRPAELRLPRECALRPWATTWHELVGPGVRTRILALASGHLPRVLLRLDGPSRRLPHMGEHASP